MTDLLIIASPHVQPHIVPAVNQICAKAGLRFQILSPEHCLGSPAPANWSARCVTLLDSQINVDESWWPEEAVRVVARDHPLATPAAHSGAKTGTRTSRGLQAVERAVVRFGQEAPSHPGDFGLMLEGGLEWLVRALPVAEPQRRRKDAPVEPLHVQTLMPVAALGDIKALPVQWVLGVLAGVVSAGAALGPALHALGAAASRQEAAA